jgi:hypothetical protein
MVVLYHQDDEMYINEYSHFSQMSNITITICGHCMPTVTYHHQIHVVVTHTALSLPILTLPNISLNRTKRARKKSRVGKQRAHQAVLTGARPLLFGSGLTAEFVDELESHATQ